MTLWGPLGLMALLAGVYLADCFNYLTSPGAGLTFRVEGRSGDLRVTTGPYSFDPWLGYVIVKDVKVRGEAGDLMASAEELRVGFPYNPASKGPVWDAWARGVWVGLERDSEGHFSFLDYLPEPTDEPSDQAYRVRVDELSVGLTDRAGGEVWSRTVRVSNLDAEGVGDLFVAVGEIAIEGSSGSFLAKVRSGAPGKVLASAQLRQVELSEVIRRLQVTPELAEFDLLRGFQVGRLVADGDLNLAFGEDPSASFVGDLIGEQPVWQEYGLDRLTFRGSIGESGAAGYATARSRGASSEGRIELRWGEESRLQFWGKASLSDSASLPPFLARHVPGGWSFQGAVFRGPVVWTDREGLHAGGEAEVRQFAVGDVDATDLRLQLSAASNKWVLRVSSGSVEGAKLEGRADFDATSRAISGGFKLAGLDLARVPALHGVEDVFGSVDSEGLLSGTIEAPVVSVRSEGLLGLTLSSTSVRMGAVQLAGTYQGDRIRIDRFLAADGFGVFSATGQIGLSDGSISGTLLASGVDIAVLYEGLSGTASSLLEISGTLDDPQYRGRLEAFSTEFADQEAPLISADIEGDLGTLRAKSWTVLRGASRLEGDLVLGFDSRQVSGAMRGPSLEVGDLLGPDYSGALMLVSGSISGTLDSPAVSGSLAGRNLVARGTRIDSLSAQVAYREGKLSLNEGEAVLGEGRVTALGEYDIDSQSSNVSATFEEISIASIAPKLPGGVTLAGTVSGEVRVGFESAVFSSLTSDFRLRDVQVNPTYVGSGFANAHFEAGKWSGEVQVGQPDRYVQASLKNWDVQSDEISGELVVFNVLFEDVFRALRTSIELDPDSGREPVLELPPAVVEELSALTAQVDAWVTVEGTSKDPRLQIQTLEAKAIRRFEEPVGAVRASGNRQGGIWTINEVRWENGPTTAVAKGVIDEHGEVNVDANLNNFVVAELGRWIPALAQVKGTANAYILASGPVESPLLEASLDATLFEQGAGSAGISRTQDPRLHLNLIPIRVQEGSLTLQGDFRFRGFQGEIEGELPFHYPFDIDKDQPVKGHLTINRRPLVELEELLPLLDIERTEGVVYGSFALSGTRDDLRWEGKFDVEGSSLAVDGVQTALSDVGMRVVTTQNEAKLTVTANGSLGGSVEAEVVGILEDIDWSKSDAFSQVLALPLSGSMSVKGFEAAEDWGAKGAAQMKVDGEVQVLGTLKSPVLRSEQPISLTQIVARAPDEFEPAGEPAEGTVVPRFDLTFRVAESDRPASLKISNGSFGLTGTGQLTGDLVRPELVANLRVADGLIRLPNARIAIEEGGDLRVLHTGRGQLESETRVDIDLEGRTSLTALRFGGLVQRYEVRLRMRGNLLDPNQQLITASADPPDISQQRILQLLGQADLIEGLGANVIGGLDWNKQVLGIAGFALPSIVDPLTERLAGEFGLEYLSFEYSAFEGPTVSAAKWLGKGLMVQYRRQLSDPVDGPIRYDLRLTYRPRWQKGFWQNVFLSLGTDEVTPYKFAIEYGRRF